jgi:hypothetical protein
MAKATSIQTSFSSGEISPRLLGRVDLNQYYAGAGTCLNFALMPHGGVVKRSGLRFVAEAKHQDRKCRLIPFEFSSEQAYVIEAGHRYCRFYKDGGRIVTESGQPYEIETPYEESDLADLTWAQSADVLFICHPGRQPMTLSRSGHTDWRLSPLDVLDGPWLDENKDSQFTLTPGTSGELVVNGQFAADLKGWVDLSDTGSSVAWDASAWANLVSDGTGYASLQQEIGLSGGMERKIQFDVKAGPIQMAIRKGRRNEPENVCTGGTATASSSVTTYHEPEMAFDDVGGSTSWSPEYFTAGYTWLQYTFQHRKTLSQARLAQSSDGWCTSVIVQKYENMNWVRVKQYDNLQAGVSIFEFDEPVSTDRIRFVFNSKIEGALKRLFIPGIHVFDLAWTYEEAYVVAEASYFNGQHEVTFTPDADCTACIIFRHNVNASRAIDAVSIPTPDPITSVVSSQDLFDALHVGAFFRLLHNDAVGYCQVVEVSNPRSATVKIIEPFGASDPTNKWREGAWSNYRGWPRCTTFHEGRLWFAGTAHQPQHIWGSVSADYYNFAPGSADTAAITLEIVSNQVNAIRWLRSAKVLLVGTVGAEWRVGEPDSTSPLTPSTASAKRENGDGSARVQPIAVAGVVLFVQRTGRKLRELAYSYKDNSFSAPDMTIISEHITAGRIVEMDYAREPDAIVWCVRGDGALLGFTYNRLEKVVGWHRHVTAGRFESVACIPGPERDEPWFVISRVVGGQERRYVECMDPVFDEQEKAGAFFVDSGLSYQGAAVATVSGLDHLEGCTVVGLADGGVVGPVVVAGGSVTLPAPASVVHLGLPYTADLGVLPVEGGAEDGSSQAKIKKLIAAAVRLYRSLGLKVGPTADNLETIPFRSSATPLGQSPALFSGWRVLEMSSDYERDGSVFIRHEQPLPCTVLAVVRHYETMSL